MPHRVALGGRRASLAPGLDLQFLELALAGVDDDVDDDDLGLQFMNVCKFAAEQARRLWSMTCNS